MKKIRQSQPCKGVGNLRLQREMPYGATRLGMTKRAIIFLFGLSLPLVPACITSGDKAVDVNPTIEQDDAYSETLDKSLRKSNVYHNFEVMYVVSATYLSPDFRSAVARRFERLYKENQPVLEEASAKAGFFVNVFTPDRSLVDLTNQRLWSMQLRVGDGKEGVKMLKPVLVKKLNEKERWRAFFPDISNWSGEFLVLFDTESINPNDPSLVQKQKMTLTLANADASVNLEW